MDDKLKDALSPLYKEYCSKVYSTDISVWTILISIHAFSMTVLSVLLKIFEPLPPLITSILFPSSLACSCISIWLMFKNITILRNFYRSCVELIYPHQPTNQKNDNTCKLNETKKDPDYDQKRVLISESIAKYCLIFNFSVFVIIVANGNKIFPFN